MLTRLVGPVRPVGLFPLSDVDAVEGRENGPEPNGTNLTACSLRATEVRCHSVHGAEPRKGGTYQPRATPWVLLHPTSASSERM